jgi:hypothetical protein
MATAEQQKENMIRLLNLMILGMAKAMWDIFGETAFATMNEVGKNILEIMEKEMGLEIAGENPKDVITEVGRIFTDEIGLVDSAKVEADGNQLRLTVDNCKGWDLSEKILSHGVDTPFTCPIMNVGEAALLRMGKYARRKIEPIPETKGSKITFTIME